MVSSSLSFSFPAHISDSGPSSSKDWNEARKRGLMDVVM